MVIDNHKATCLFFGTIQHVRTGANIFLSGEEVSVVYQEDGISCGSGSMGPVVCQGRRDHLAIRIYGTSYLSGEIGPFECRWRCDQ